MLSDIYKLLARALTDGLPYTDRYGNDIYTDFRNMLKLEQIFHTDEIADDTKITYALRLIYGDEFPKNLTLKQMINELLYFYARENKEISEENNTSKNTSKKLYDFNQDADYIFSAFLSIYNIDLYEEETYLHWWKFMAMFIALPEDTQMQKRIYYRSVDTSKMKGRQKKEYESIKKTLAIKNIKATKEHLSREEIEKRTIDRINKRYEEAERQLKNKKHIV